MWFQKKNESLNSREYESCSKKLTELSGKIEELDTKFKILGTNYDNLRGQFNRKLSGIKKEEQTEEMQETETNKNPSIFLTPNGTPI